MSREETKHEEYEKKETGGCGNISYFCLLSRIFNDLSDAVAARQLIQEQ